MNLKSLTKKFEVLCCFKGAANVFGIQIMQITVSEV